MFTSRYNMLGAEDFSLEAIAHQFGYEKEINQLVDIVKASRADFNYKEFNNSNFFSIIEKMFNLKFKVVHTEETLLGIAMPTVLHDHPFYKKYKTSDTETKLNSGELLQGIKNNAKLDFRVDLATGKVSGSVTKQVYRILLHPDMIDKNTYIGGRVTARMMVSGIMHEIFHLIGFFEWGHRINSLNAVLTGFSDEMFKNFSQRERRVIIKSLKDEGLISKSNKTLEDAKNSKEATLILIGDSITRSISETGYNIYDRRSSEAIADQGAVRMGLGKDTVLLQKLLFEESGTKEHMSTRWRLDSVPVLRFIVGGLLLTLPLGPMLAATIMLMCASLKATRMTGPQDYDDPITRMKVIRKDMIGRLKAAKDKDIKNQIAKDIAEIDELLKDEKIVEPFLISLGMIISPSAARSKQQINIQKALEHFANSEINLLINRLENE